MFTISSIREKARQTLSQTPGIYQLTAIPVIISVIFQLFSIVQNQSNSLGTMSPEEMLSFGYIASSLLFPIFYGLLQGLLVLSCLLVIVQLVKGRKEATSYRDVLSLFNHKDFGKFLATYLLKSLLLFLWGLLFYIGLTLFLAGSILMATLAVLYTMSDAGSLPQEALAGISLLLFGGLILIVLGLALYIPQVYAYSQVEFILFEQVEREEYTGAFSIIKSSRHLMKGYKFKRFVLDLTFIGWFILVGISLGLAGLYVLPYYLTAQAHFHEEILDDQAKKMNYVYE